MAEVQKQIADLDDQAFAKKWTALSDTWKNVKGLSPSRVWEAVKRAERDTNEYYDRYHALTDELKKAQSAPAQSAPAATPASYPNFQAGALVDRLSLAIAKVEAGDKPNPISVRNNNPGNLREWGFYPTVQGYAKFPDWETGFTALQRQVRENIKRGLTLREFFAGKAGVYPGFAPKADRNDPDAYANTVAKILKIDVDTPLSRLLATQRVPAGNASASAAVGTNAVREMSSRPILPPPPQITPNRQSFEVNLGGIFITQPGADARQIQRAVSDGVRDGLRSQVQTDLAQLAPAY